MHDEILAYYQRELTMLRQLGRHFATRYPIIAGRLQLTADSNPDPHVERLIESFALIAARINHKIDDSFPEITEGMLAALYPHLVRPVPARTIVQFESNPAQPIGKNACRIPCRTMLETPHLRGGNPGASGVAAEPLSCRFRTVYPVELWPLHITDVSYQPLDRSPLRRLRSQGQSVLRVRLACRDEMTFGQLPLDSLRFFLDGEPGAMHVLHELMHTALVDTMIGTVNGSDADAASFSPAPSVRLEPVGFAADQGMLDYDARSHIGYRLLHEYFTFPEKFLFVDAVGLKPALPPEASCVDVCFVFAGRERPDITDDDLSMKVGAQSLKLGCTPVVNLFPLSAEPIRITHEVDAHPIIPDIRRPAAYEVYAVESVSLLSRGGEVQRRPIPALLGEHRIPAAARSGLSWFTSRQPSPDDGADLFLHLVDQNLAPSSPTDMVLGVTVTATNRDLPLRMPVNQPGGDLVLSETSPIIRRIVCLRKPRRPIRPGFGGDRLWQLVSHLTLNRLSLADAETLRGLLGLYNLADPRKDPHLYNQMQQQISGITAVTAQPVIDRFGPLSRACFIQGVEIVLTVDEDHFVGGGAYLFASVLERFFGLYGAANSFTRLRLQSQQRKGAIATWASRAGDAILI